MTKTEKIIEAITPHITAQNIRNSNTGAMETKIIIDGKAAAIISEIIGDKPAAAAKPAKTKKGGTKDGNKTEGK